MKKIIKTIKSAVKVTKGEATIIYSPISGLIFVTVGNQGVYSKDNIVYHLIPGEKLVLKGD